jgi:hypothetical protein
LRAIARIFRDRLQKPPEDRVRRMKPSEELMSLKTVLFAAVLVFAACTSLPMPGFLRGSQNQTQTSSSTSSHTVNGHPVGEDDPIPEPAVAKTKQEKKQEAGFGKTCHHNSDCPADACYVGAGDIGYCTSYCETFSDCPSFWECKAPGNAPQRICMQDRD